MRELIYLDKNALSPAGGPLGVGYYIYEESRRAADQSIEFLETNIKVKNRETKQKKILYKFPRVTKIVRSIRHIIEYKKMFNSPIDNSVKFRKFDIIHFHSTSDMYKQRKSLEKYEGKVLLTSHSPIPLAQELYSACATNFERRYFAKRIDKFEEMDRWSFIHADYIIFPCPEAEEPYQKNWKAYTQIKELKKDCYRYVLTGISPRIANFPKDKVRSMYGISLNDFVVVYVGRHNEVKGYGNLKKIGKSILKNDSNIKFLIAGKEAPLTRLKDPAWIEVGFTEDPYSIISAADVFILPNNETYFDLVMIEVLSLGKIVIASRTGGNKYYEKVGVKGVFLYNTLEEAVDIIYKVKCMTNNEKKALEESNKRFYQENLTSKVFYENYKKMIVEL